MPQLGNALSALASAPNVLDVRRLTVDYATALGFGGVFFLTPIARDHREGRVLTHVGFDEDWARSYRGFLHRNDPLPEIALRRSAPFRWSEAAAYKDLSTGEQRYLKLLTQGGKEDGLIVPTFGPGSRTGLAGFGRHPDLNSLTALQIASLHAVLQASYLRYCDLVTAQFEQESRLSQREMDVLLWISRGKSNAAMATILDLSPDTIDTYVRRIYKKFGVSDRVAAALAAVQQGYLITGEYRREAEKDPAD